MLSLRYAAPANRDLREIAAYSAENWSEAQAAEYVTGIREVCVLLCTNPELGRLVPEIRPGVRKISHRRHFILYRIVTEEIRILRILHECMKADGRILH